MSIFGNLFKWQSAADQKKEQERYEKWAFPYGEKQRDSLKSLLVTIFKKDDGFILYTYLMCKEMYEKYLEDFGSRDIAVRELIACRKKNRLQIIRQLKQNEWLNYIALVLADEDIDESSEYPTADQIITKAQELGDDENLR